MRIDLRVPYAEKDWAKKLGARWDAAMRVWYIVDHPDIDKFIRWMPEETLGMSREKAEAIANEVSRPSKRSKSKEAATHRRLEKAAKKAPKERLNGYSGGTFKGLDFFQVECDCLPWVGCDKCHAKLASMQWPGLDTGFVSYDPVYTDDLVPSIYSFVQQLR